MLIGCVTTLLGFVKILIGCVRIFVEFLMILIGFVRNPSGSESHSQGGS